MLPTTTLHPTPAPAISFRAGDIARALAEGLKHGQVADDIDAVLSDLLFTGDDHAHDIAREMLFDLLKAHSSTTGQTASNPDKNPTLKIITDTLKANTGSNHHG